MFPDAMFDSGLALMFSSQASQPPLVRNSSQPWSFMTLMFLKESDQFCGIPLNSGIPGIFLGDMFQAGIPSAGYHITEYLTHHW